jgi:hypothetical protein
VSPSPGSGTWQLERFLLELDLWIEREPDLGDDARLPVLAWVQSRMDDPYLDVRREEQIDNLWYGVIPHAPAPGGRVAVGSYFVFETQKLVRCNSFALLHPPV